ncbi:MAG: phosphoribulokinase [Cyanobacteriota bacterium]|nr:phosphoribulokinase [Cyanobacteriota bacterium]
MIQRRVILGIVGDSAAGKTTLTRGIAQVLGTENVTTLCTDDYHRYNRAQRSELGMSALHPDCNYLDIIEQHLSLVRRGQPILKPIYNHKTGDFDPPEYLKPNKFAIVEGLLGYFTRGTREGFDVKVYLAPPESLRKVWKIQRDTSKRGYTEEKVLASLAKREPDSAQFIRPQRQWADVIVTFYPPPESRDEKNQHLNVRLVLRPTIAHPDIVQLFETKGFDSQSAMRLELDRDMGKPVDVLEIDGNATAEQVRELEKILCSEVPDLESCRIDRNFEIGKLTGTTGETIQSYPLALTQLLIAYHMLKASSSYQ